MLGVLESQALFLLLSESALQNSCSNTLGDLLHKLVGGRKGLVSLSGLIMHLAIGAFHLAGSVTNGMLLAFATALVFMFAVLPLATFFTLGSNTANLHSAGAAGTAAAAAHAIARTATLGSVVVFRGLLALFPGHPLGIIDAGASEGLGQFNLVFNLHVCHNLVTLWCEFVFVFYLIAHFRGVDFNLITHGGF